MKNLKNKIVSAALAFVLAATALTPVTVNAAVTYSEEQTVYLSSKTGTDYKSIYVGNLGSKEKIKNVKSSKKSVVKPYSISTYTSDDTTKYEYLENSDWNSSSKDSSKYAYIGCQLLKKGTATISFDVYNTKTKKSSTKKAKITVKAYENPAKTVNIAGIKNGSSTNLASKTKSQSTASLTLKSKKKNASVYAKANTDKNWKIVYASVYNETNGNTYTISNYSKPLSSVKFSNIGTIKAKEYARVNVDYYNTKTKAYMYTYYYINN